MNNTVHKENIINYINYTLFKMEQINDLFEIRVGRSQL